MRSHALALIVAMLACCGATVPAQCTLSTHCVARESAIVPAGLEDSASLGAATAPTPLARAEACG